MQEVDICDTLFEDCALDPQEEWESIERSLDPPDMADPFEDIMDYPPSLLDTPPVAPEPESTGILQELSASPLTVVVAGDVVDTLSSFFTIVAYDEGSLLTDSAFSADGSYDHSNGCRVMGGVVGDIEYVDGQTGPTCSLMAQEQFVERYINQDIPEPVLEWRAESWGYYEPAGLGAGTNWLGQASLLEHFDIPHSREFGASIDDLDASLAAGNDVIIGVDARVFYQDATLPPGSGHAVAVVGWGCDPATGETVGYYITDSNFPGTVRFVAPQQLGRSWQSDMISVAAPGE